MTGRDRLGVVLVTGALAGVLGALLVGGAWVLGALAGVW